jgi:hypothetical protein
MKKFTFLLLVAILGLSMMSAAQSSTKKYWVSGMEIPFQWATIKYDGTETGSVMRFAPFLNITSYFNIDPSRSFGFITGLAVRNVGFIYDVPETTTRMKFRNYNVGIPVGVKVGKMTGTFVYGGYEIEFPFVYKEKKFENEVKTEKFVIWFSGRVPSFYNTVFIGINLIKGLNVKFKYYFTNFHDQDYTEVVDGVENQPYKKLKSNVMYVSVSFNLFRNAKLVYSRDDFR